MLVVHIQWINSIDFGKVRGSFGVITGQIVKIMRIHVNMTCQGGQALRDLILTYRYLMLGR